VTDSATRPAHGPGSAWDTPEAVGRVEGAYRADDVTAIRAAQIALLGPLAGLHVLDVGAGPGIFARDLALAGARVTAVDSAPAMLAAAAAEAERAGVELELLAGDAAAPPVADGSYDAAAVVQVIEYVPDPVGCLAAVARAVRPGGQLLVCDTDWTTASWGIPDPALAERVKAGWCATKEHADAGRRIPEWLAAAGCRVVAWDPRLLAVADATGDTFHAHTWPSYRATLERTGALTAAELERFGALCAEATARGAFSFTVVRHAWLARVGGGAP
jgi:SAM-dependent methyltransferase